jgi:hypothetical protein
MSWWSCFEENPESATISSSLKAEPFPASFVPAIQKPGKSKNISKRKERNENRPRLPNRKVAVKS